MSKLHNILENINEIKKIISEDTSPDERAIRELLSQEYEAVKTYEEAAVKAENELTRKVMFDISREELVHIGELEELLSRIGMSTKDVYGEGANEINDLQKELENGKETPLEEAFNISNPNAYFEVMFRELYSTYKRNPSGHNKGRLEQAQNIMRDLVGQKSGMIINKVTTDWATNKFR